MGKYIFHSQRWSRTGCPGEYLDPGWYTAVGDKFIIREWINSSTGKPYTNAELDKIQGYVVPPYVKPTMSASSALIWLVGIMIATVVVVVWFVLK